VGSGVAAASVVRVGGPLYRGRYNKNPYTHILPLSALKVDFRGVTGCQATLHGIYGTVPEQILQNHASQSLQCPTDPPHAPTSTFHPHPSPPTPNGTTPNGTTTNPKPRSGPSNAPNRLSPLPLASHDTARDLNHDDDGRVMGVTGEAVRGEDEAGEGFWKWSAW
jgi:hypothetical protein